MLEQRARDSWNRASEILSLATTSSEILGKGTICDVGSRAVSHVSLDCGTFFLAASQSYADFRGQGLTSIGLQNTSSLGFSFYAR